MKHETAVKAKNTCISTMMILAFWAMGHLKVSKESIAKNPDTVGLAFILAYGIPVLILFILSIVYAVIAKKTEFDDLDE